MPRRFLQQNRIAQDLYEKRHPIAEICQPSRSPKPRCTGILKLGAETNNLQDNPCPREIMWAMCSV
jgi:hypothetical protein